MEYRKTTIIWTIIGTISLVIVLVVLWYYEFPMDWSLIVAMTAVIVAVYSSSVIYRFSKIDRAFSHSVYKSDRYLDAFDSITSRFPELNDGKAGPPTPKEISEWVECNAKNRRNINIVLNHWGRFASEYYAGILDCDRAKDMLKPQFDLFFGFFGRYFKWTNPVTNKPVLCRKTYSNTFRLMDEWKPEARHCEKR